MDFYQRLLSHKALMKLSWKQIGDIVDKKEATIRLAVDRESLSKLEIAEIEKHLLIEQKDGNTIPISKKSNHKISKEDILKVVELIYLNEDELMKNRLFSNWVKLKKEEGAVEALEELKKKKK